MSVFEQLAVRIALRYLEGAVTPEAVDNAEAKLVEALKGLVAKTPNKFDDKILDAVLKVVTEGGIGAAIEAELVKLGDVLVAGTETDLDDKVWAIVRAAIVK